MWLQEYFKVRVISKETTMIWERRSPGLETLFMWVGGSVCVCVGGGGAAFNECTRITHIHCKLHELKQGIRAEAMGITGNAVSIYKRGVVAPECLV